MLQRLIFETDSLSQVSPSTLCRCGTVHLDEEAPSRCFMCCFTCEIQVGPTWSDFISYEEVSNRDTL